MAMTSNADLNVDDPEVMMDINTTPLIDVMLVLLVMLIITIPVQLHAVNLDLPVGRPPVSAVVPDKIQIDINPQSELFWQGLPVTIAQLEVNMAEAAHQATQAEVHVRPDKNAQYAVFASVLAASRRHGLTRMAVVGSEQFLP
ncbi:MAG: biopolymer transporter ExbD [Rhodoferax sp.]|uniref:ExbD/TolR family protein n=1 Tax=Rhodoferax sp. TaxID=50421 RepID=UPI003018A41A